MSGATLEAAGVDPTVLRDRFFDLWSRKEAEALRVVAYQGFGELAEPLEGLLSILESCPGKQKGRGHTLGHCLVLEFQRWRKEHPTVTLGSVPELQAVRLQSRALALLTDGQSAFMDHLLDIYQLKSLDLARLRLHVVKLQALNSYREAALLSTKLKLQDELDMEEMCIPLILQDRMSSAEAYVSGSPQLEQRLVTLLDSWCHHDFTMAEIQRRFPRLCLSKHQIDQIQPKMLSKHVFRLMDKYNVDPALCPNSVFKRRQDSLRFLMYKRFVEKGMSEENWNDHVQSTVGEDPELQVNLVELVTKYCGLRSASQWSLRYSVPRNRLPFGVWDAQQDLPGLQQECGTDSAKREEWVPPRSHRDRFYQLPITRDQVHFLDTLDGLQQCRCSLLKAGAVVGVDMEWRAGFGCVSSQRVALIQLAVADQVFLLDLCASEFCQHQDTASFIRTLFSDKNILKLGYGMAGDLRCLVGTWPQFAQEPLNMEGMLDLLNLHQQVQRSGVRRGGRRGVLVGKDAPAEKGLSLMVQQVLGRPLDKMEQLSNWDRRPLRTSQIRYAAADAYCLLDLYTALSSDPAGFGLPADLCSVRSNQSQKSKEQKEQKKQEAKAAKRIIQPKEERQRDLGNLAASGGPETSPLGRESACERAPMAPQQLRVVCDNMLQGLGKHLRCLGVDVLMLGNTDDHRVAAQLAQAESRVILTCGQPYQSLRSQVGEGRCLFLDCSEKARDQAVRVLHHFNVQPTARDIFSRCQACNGDQYMRLPREDMARMLRERGFLQDQPTDHTEVNSHQQEGEEPGDILTSSVIPDLPRYAPQCRWAPISDLDPNTLTFPGGAGLQLHTVPPGLLPRVPLFYVCTSCGKVFWEGSHFSRVLSQFQDVLHITEEDTSLTTVAMATAQQN